jgi:hypothetical protein
MDEMSVQDGFRGSYLTGWMRCPYETELREGIFFLYNIHPSD